MFNTGAFKTKIKETETWLEKEFSLIRTGRANPAFLDGVRVDSYGALVPINQVGNINVEDARAIRITPWDQSQIKPVEKAIIAANLGVSVVVDDKGLRVIFPELTGDKRKEIVKMAKDKFEHARISLRKHRDDTINDIEKKLKAKELTEDDRFRLKNDIQKIIDEANKKLEAMMTKKEREILG